MKAYTLYVLMPVLLVIGACGHRAEEPDPALAEKVSVEDFQYTLLPGGARIISGKLKNPTAELIKNAQIQINLFDEDNRFVSTMSVIVQDVKPGEQKAFREAVDGDASIQGAKVRGVLLM